MRFLVCSPQIATLPVPGVMIDGFGVGGLPVPVCRG